jgi:hypothetical protein
VIKIKNRRIDDKIEKDFTFKFLEVGGFEIIEEDTSPL